MAGEQRILIVEDDETRCAWFRERLRGHQLDVTCEVVTAIRWLGERDYRAVLLDHDLTLTSTTSRTSPTTSAPATPSPAGSPTTRPRSATPLILIHSLNYTGAARMLGVLRDAGREAEHIPFHHLQRG